ncbi:MAG TPA: DUF2007 domain-containing protein [Flavobacteriales bacterium]|jgi:hypothetical protein|nr:DUF2007 domain-containing protein [Flavobacteriales bacterium]
MGDWALVVSTPSRSEAELIRGRLEEHDIRSVIMDQRSSAYPTFGEVGVYVEREDVLRALYLVRQAEGP